MTHDEIRQDIIRFLNEHETLPAQVLDQNLDYNYIDAGHIDSISIINFIYKLENHFKISIQPVETHSLEFRTINGLTNYIQNKLSA